MALILSRSPMHGKLAPYLLSLKLEARGIPMLYTQIAWPRDELFFHKDGRIEEVQNGTDQPQNSSHFAWNGGAYLKGPDFIIASETEPSYRRQKTEQLLGVAKAHYVDLSQENLLLSRFNETMLSDFYRQDSGHIDPIYNLGNEIRTLFTYDHPMLIEKAEEIADRIGYSTLHIPLEEAAVAAIGFIEVEGMIVIDGRAVKSASVIEDAGYEVIPTPLGLKRTNQNRGSLRCMTDEFPFDLESVLMMSRKKAQPHWRDITYRGDLLSDRKGRGIICEGFSYQMEFKN